MGKALVILTDGVEEIEAVTIVDVLRRGGVQVTTASIGASAEVAGAHGMALKADALFADVQDGLYDALVLPGGPGTANLRQSKAVLERLRRQKEDGGLICAICAAPAVLVEAGVLDEDQHVTCYPSVATELDRPCANVPVVADGAVITGQAPGSAMLFALVVLKAIVGEPGAIKVARGLVTDVL